MDRLVQIVQGENFSKLALGMALRDAKRNDNWRQMVGEGIDKWDDFLKQPELSISRLEAERLIKMADLHDYMIDNLNISGNDIVQIPYSNWKKLVELPRENIVVDVVNQAISLTPQDFKEVLVENTGEQSRTYKYMVMRKCLETGNMTKLHGIESDTIKETFNINE